MLQHVFHIYIPHSKQSLLKKKDTKGFHGFIDKGTPGVIYTYIILNYLNHPQYS